MLRLAPRYIFPRSRRETAEAIEQFKVFLSMQNTSGNWSLRRYICSNSIVAPNVGGKADYFSQKQSYTISTQGLVGANLVFLDVATGFPGSCHDARNFRNTSLYTQAENRES